MAIASGNNKKFMQELQTAVIFQFNGEFATPDYVHIPTEEETPHPDDVVLELNFQEREVDFTLSEIAKARSLGDGVYFVPNRGYLRCLTQAAVH